jgi:serine/threonine protein kinase
VLKLLLDPEDWNAEIRGYNNSNSNPAVVKVIALMSLPAREVNELCRGIKGYLVRPTFEKVPVMVFEKWAGSLREAIDSGTIREWGLLTAVGLMKDVARAVSYMHADNIMHRDIKPDNILHRTIGVKCSAGLCDLGLATKCTSKGGDLKPAFTQGVGTNKYMAPECAGGVHYAVSADVYSLAVTTWEVCIASCRLRTQLPDHIKRLVKKGYSRTPNERLTSRQFYLGLKHIYKALLRETPKGSPHYVDAYVTCDTPMSESGGTPRRNHDGLNFGGPPTPVSSLSIAETIRSHELEKARMEEEEDLTSVEEGSEDEEEEEEEEEAVVPAGQDRKLRTRRARKRKYGEEVKAEDEEEVVEEDEEEEDEGDEGDEGESEEVEEDEEEESEEVEEKQEKKAVKVVSRVLRPRQKRQKSGIGRRKGYALRGQPRIDDV